MLIGQLMWRIARSPMVVVFILAIVLFLGIERNKTPSLYQLPKLSILQLIVDALNFSK